MQNADKRWTSAFCILTSAIRLSTVDELTRITVLLADDHALVRRGFRRILEDDPDIEVVGEASNGEEAIRLFGELKPTVIVMDAAMPGTGGLAATRAILASAPDATVLMLSMHSEETLVRQAMAAGARGYILKNAVDLDLAARSSARPPAKRCSTRASSSRRRCPANAPAA